MLDIHRLQEEFDAAQAAARKIQESSAWRLASQSAFVTQSASAEKLAKALGVGSSQKIAESAGLRAAEAFKQLSAFERFGVSAKLDPGFLSATDQSGMATDPGLPRSGVLQRPGAPTG